MSRSKKSRKPGVGSSGPVKEKDTSKSAKVVPEKRIKKLKGKPSGNRQNEAKPVVKNQQATTNKDPRIGNKTPIDLGKPMVMKPKKAKTQSKGPSVAPIRTIEPEEIIDTQALMDELETIEQDQRLLSILSKQDDDIDLSESEIDFFNEQMDKHQALREKLGLDDDEEEEDDNESASSEDENDLWDKFDNSDLSKFE